MRETVFWIMFCFLLALAAFESGWIVRDRQRDNTQERLLKIEERIREQGARMVVLEGPDYASRAKPRLTPKASSGKPNKE
jgi:hypothetical protein